MMLNLAGFLNYSTANGPGKRAVVWAQGCPLRCPGCFNPGLQRFEQRFLTDPTILAENIIGIEGIEGVTFSGGEPFCQAEGLAEVGRRVRNEGLNVISFTGFEYDVLTRKSRKSWNNLVKSTDLLVAGPYRSGLPCRHPLLSSQNQELVYLSDEFRGRITEAVFPPVLEYSVRPGGVITGTGFPEQDGLPDLS